MTTLPAFPAHVSSAPEYPLQEFSQTTASVENLQEQLEAIAGASEIPASPVPFDEIVEVQRYPPMTLYGVGGILKNISEVMEGLTQATGQSTGSPVHHHPVRRFGPFVQDEWKPSSNESVNHLMRRHPRVNCPLTRPTDSQVSWI